MTRKITIIKIYISIFLFISTGNIYGQQTIIWGKKIENKKWFYNEGDIIFTNDDGFLLYNNYKKLNKQERQKYYKYTRSSKRNQKKYPLNIKAKDRQIIIKFDENGNEEWVINFKKDNHKILDLKLLPNTDDFLLIMLNKHLSEITIYKYSYKKKKKWEKTFNINQLSNNYIFRSNIVGNNYCMFIIEGAKNNKFLITEKLIFYCFNLETEILTKNEYNQNNILLQPKNKNIVIQTFSGDYLAYFNNQMNFSVIKDSENNINANIHISYFVPTFNNNKMISFVSFYENKLSKYDSVYNKLWECKTNYAFIHKIIKISDGYLIIGSDINNIISLTKISNDGKLLYKKIFGVKYSDNDTKKEYNKKLSANLHPTEDGSYILSCNNLLANSYFKSWVIKTMPNYDIYIEYQKLDKKNIYACVEFNKKYPNSQYFSIVEEKITELEKIPKRIYKKAIEGDIFSCREYLFKYPNGEFVKEIKYKIISLEEKCYQLACKGDLEDIIFYFSCFPEGKYIKELTTLKNNIVNKIYSNKNNINEYKIINFKTIFKGTLSKGKPDSGFIYNYKKYESSNYFYCGKINNGNPDSIGIIYYDNGDYFAGKTKGHKHIQGTYFRKDGTKLKGIWAGHQFIYTFSNGITFSGDFYPAKEKYKKWKYTYWIPIYNSGIFKKDSTNINNKELGKYFSVNNLTSILELSFRNNVGIIINNIYYEKDCKINIPTGKINVKLISSVQNMDKVFQIEPDCEYWLRIYQDELDFTLFKSNKNIDQVRRECIKKNERIYLYGLPSNETSLIFNEHKTKEIVEYTLNNVELSKTTISNNYNVNTGKSKTTNKTNIYYSGYVFVKEQLKDGYLTFNVTPHGIGKYYFTTGGFIFGHFTNGKFDYLQEATYKLADNSISKKGYWYSEGNYENYNNWLYLGSTKEEAINRKKILDEQKLAKNNNNFKYGYSCPLKAKLSNETVKFCDYNCSIYKIIDATGNEIGEIYYSPNNCFLTSKGWHARGFLMSTPYGDNLEEILKSYERLYCD